MLILMYMEPCNPHGFANCFLHLRMYPELSPRSTSKTTLLIGLLSNVSCGGRDTHEGGKRVIVPIGRLSQENKIGSEVA